MLQKIDEHWYTEYILDVSGLLDYSWKGIVSEKEFVRVQEQ